MTAQVLAPTLSTEAPLSHDAPGAPIEAAVVDTAPKGFLGTLPEDLRGVKSLQNFKDATELAKSYAHQSALLGKRVEDWAGEDLGKIYGKFGRPDSAEAYVLPDELSNKEEFVKTAFEAGLTQDQAKKFADRMIEAQRESGKSLEIGVKELEENWAADLQKEFGSAYNNRIELAQRAANNLASDGLKNLLKETGLDKHPEMIKLFSSIGKKYMENDTIVAGDKDGRFGITPNEARARINTKLADTEFRAAYFSAVHPKHDAAVQELAGMYALLNSNNG